MARPGRPERSRKPDHSASLGDSITSSTRIRFSVHTPVCHTPSRSPTRQIARCGIGLQIRPALPYRPQIQVEQGALCSLCRDRDRALPTIRLGYVNPPRRQCPIRSPMDAGMQVLEIALKVLLVVPTCQPIHPRCSILLEFKECLLEVIDTDGVEERGELLLLPLPCSLPYALQRLGHAHPVLRPARALLARISLGLRP